MTQPVSSRSVYYLTALTVGLFLLAVYLATHDLTFHMIDEPGSFVVSRNLAARTTFEIDTFFWVRYPLGIGSIVADGMDGHTYLAKDFSPLLLGAPMVWLADAIGTSPVRTSLMLFPVITALTGGLLAAFVQARGSVRITGVLAALVFGLASLAWPYAGSLFSQPLAALGLLIAHVGSVSAHEKRDWKSALVAGLGLGLAGTSSSSPWVLLPLYPLYLISWEMLTKASWKKTLKHSLPLLIAFGLGAGAFFLSHVAYNYVRFGTFFATGHGQFASRTFSLLYLGQGTIGQSISIVRGLIWFTPFTLLIPFGLWLGWKKRLRWLALALGESMLFFLLISSFYSWWGGHTWGPRYLVVIMPILTLLVVPVLDYVFQPGRWFTRTAVGAVIVISGLTQLLAVLLDWLRTEVDVAYQLSLVTPASRFWHIDAILFDPRVIPQMRLIETLREGAWDVLWVSNGRFDGLLFMLQLSVVTAALGLLVAAVRYIPPRWLPAGLAVQVILTISLSIFMLARYPQGPNSVPGLDALVESLKTRTQPGDGVMTVLPVSYLDWIDSYDSASHDIGMMLESPLNPRTEHMLGRVPGWHDRIWLVTEGTMGGNPENGVERWLASHAFVGAENWIEGYRLVPYTFNGVNASDLSPVGREFGTGEIELQSYSAEVVQPGSGEGWINVTLQWAAHRQLEMDYVVFVHLLDSSGALVAQHDGLPVAAYMPTHSWESGSLIEDRHSIALPGTLSPGEYRLTVGLYDPLTGVRLPLSDGLGDVLFLRPIEINHLGE